MIDTDDSLGNLKTDLHGQTEHLAETLLGPPNKALSNRRELRFGNKGSLAISIAGAKRGCWFDHETRTGGHELALIRHVHSGTWAEAIAWARDWIGSREHRRADRLQPRRPEPTGRAAEAAADKAKRIRIARQLWHASGPVTGPGAIYLSRTRSIPEPVRGWPAEAMRYHAASNRLILAATLDDGTVQAVQAVQLTPDGRKIEGVAKRSHGVQAGAVVRLPGDPNGPLLLAEGPETGLSVWRATQHETWIALGSVAKIDLPGRRRIVVCADDDNRHATKGRDNNAHKARTKAVAGWRSAGHDIAVAYPWTERRQDKTDFNDLIQLDGVQAVHARVSLALNPIGDVRRVPVAETRAHLHDLVKKFFDDAGIWHPAPHGEEKGWPAPPVIATDPGVASGKSASAHQNAVRMVSDLRAKNDHRNVAIACPTHALNVAQAQAIMALPEAQTAGLTVRVWHGRKRADPEQPDKDMCWDLDAIADAQAAGLAPQDAVCGAGETKCQFANQCGYQKQRKERADIWLVAHELLFITKPSALGTLAAVVIDEGFTKAGLTGVEAADGHALAVDALRVNLEIPGDVEWTKSINEMNRQNGWPDAASKSVALNSSRRKRLAMIEASSDGGFIRLKCQRAQLTQAEAITAAALTRQCLPVARIWPGMPAVERKAIVHVAKGNRTITRDAALWDHLAALLADDGPEASGWAGLDTIDNDQGNVRVIRLKHRSHVRKGWRVPTLILDATLNPDLVRPFYPNVMVERVAPSAAPFMRITQVIDKAFTSSSLVTPPPKNLDAKLTAKTQTEARRRAANLTALRHRIILMARRYAPRTVLVVLQKAVEAALLALGDLSANVQTGHHNALRGRNDFEAVRLLIVVGRTMPSPASVERQAEALTGRAMVPITGWYPKVDAIRETPTGSVLISSECHPDPDAEAFRWQACEGEVIQIIGRGRGVNRTAANPLDVLVMTDVPLPLPIDQMVSAQDLELTIRETQIATGGAAFGTPAHAFIAYPDMWPSEQAARLAFHREAQIQSATNPNKESLIGECSTLYLVSYQRVGARQHRVTAWMDLAEIPDPRAYLERLLGPLARYEVIAPNTPPAASASPPETVADLPKPAPLQTPEARPMPFLLVCDGAMDAQAFPPELVCLRHRWVAAPSLRTITMRKLLPLRRFVSDTRANIPADILLPVAALAWLLPPLSLAACQ